MKLAPDTVLMHHLTPLGGVTLAATDHGLAGLWFEDQRHHPDLSTFPCVAQHPLLSTTCRQLDAYFEGLPLGPMPPLDLRGGTPFQQQVWHALLTLAPGQHCSYGELAARIGRPAAVRAVGTAIGRNPISIVVPCHRVLGGSGQLTGYAGGLDRKRHLLTLEGVL
jgi:methylated-DNA-[protein]-cysteine S-methyltransferase